MVLKKLWRFIWYDNSFLSLAVNIALAFVVVKFMIYPLAGLILSTTHPMVAVVSGSMEHTANFELWWEENKEWYLKNQITKEDFKKFSFNEGFNKGDIMVLIGTDNLNVGDVVVYQSQYQYPIIHRITEKKLTNQGYFYSTKGDNNPDKDPRTTDKIIGKSVFRIPFLGYTKIIFAKITEGFL